MASLRALALVSGVLTAITASDTLNVAALDTATSTSWAAFGTNGTSGSIGRSGQTVTFPGNVTVTGTLTASIAANYVGLTTSGVTTGLAGYYSSADTVSLAQNDSTGAKSEAIGFNTGTSGSMQYAGEVEIAMTTAGGSPAVGAPIYLAALADDTNAGAGKGTATLPATGYVKVLGYCRSAANYSGSKTATMAIQFQPSVNVS